MKRKFLLLLIVAVLVLSGLTLARGQETASVRLAVIPVLDTLPLFIAEQQGHFEAEGLAVELIPVTSGIERDQLIQAGEADGMLTDIPGVGFFNETETRVQIVYTSRVALEDGPIFRILSAPGSNIATPQDLAGVPIGVSEATIIEYLTYRLLEGADIEDIVTEAVPSIPVRFQLLMEGELQAATLPDPLAQAAIQLGANLVIEDTSLQKAEFSQSVLVFSSDFIEENPETIAAFLRAWDTAVEELNMDTEAFRGLFLERTIVPEPVQETYTIPPFPRGMITSEAVWDDYMDWMLSLDIIDAPPAYADSVNDSFVPEVEDE